MQKLYRIISLESFLSLLLNSEDRLSRPIDCWEDTYEGYLFRLIERRDEKTKKVIERLYHDVSENSAEKTIANLAKLLRCRYTCYCMCWSKIVDSDAMWRIYSYDQKAIQLVSSKEKLRNTMENSCFAKTSYCIEDVQYDDNDDLLSLSKLFGPGTSIHDTLLHKRIAFRHEDEVRVISHFHFGWDVREGKIKNDLLREYSNSKSNDEIEKIYEALLNLNIEEHYHSSQNKTFNIKISDLNQYIEGVRVHPQAKDWYLSLVHRLCLDYKVNFMGKSKLYNEI